VCTYTYMNKYIRIHIHTHTHTHTHTHIHISQVQMHVVRVLQTAILSEPNYIHSAALLQVEN
jgi:hypothetical protein